VKAMLTPSEFLIIVAVVAGAIAVTGRWVYYKRTGKELVEGDSNLILNLRNTVVSSLLEGIHLKEIETEQGRDAVRDEIAAKAKQILAETTALTEGEKELVSKLDFTLFIALVEKELISRGVLEPEKA
jgi:hypothetical protein